MESFLQKNSISKLASEGPVLVNGMLNETKMVFTCDFISGELNKFHFGVWLISYNWLHDTTRNETHCRCYFIGVILLSHELFNVKKAQVG